MKDIMMNAKKFVTGSLLAYELRSRGTLYPSLVCSLPENLQEIAGIQIHFEELGEF